MTTNKADSASPRLLKVVSFILATSLGVCWLNYPLMIFGTSGIFSYFWFGGLVVAAVAFLMLLIIVLRYVWLTFLGRCSAALMVTSVGVFSGFIALWFYYFRFLERMP